MIQQLSFQKVFSGYTGLSQAKTITYVLIEKVIRGVPMYGIQVTEEISGNLNQEEIPLFTENQKWAQSLLTLLFENAVPVVHCSAVINDACAAYDEME